MLNIRKEIIEINHIYVQSCDRSALNKAEKRLFELLNYALIDDENRKNSEALIIKLSCKRAAILYFLEGYCKSDYEKLVQFADRAKIEASEKGYLQTAHIVKKLLETAKNVAGIMEDAPHYIDTIKNENGDCIAATVEACNEVAEIFKHKLQIAQTLQDDAIFGTDVIFPSVKECVLKDLQEVIEFAVTNAERMKNAELERLYDHIVERPDKTLLSYYFRPDAIIDATKPNAIVLCTPLKNEGELFAIANCASRGKELSVIKAGVFTAISKEKLDELFLLLQRQDNDILIKGLNRYIGSNKSDIIQSLVALGKKGKKVFILDNSSQKENYEYAQQILKDTSTLSILDISFMYLSMPEFNQIREEFVDRGKESDVNLLYANRGEIKFAGYVGFNKAFNAMALGRDWMRVLKAESNRNEEKALKYLRGLSSQLPLLDYGWGDLNELTAQYESENKTPFDYDSIRALNYQNVRAILEGDYSICEKCGIIARYATLHGADLSEWHSLTDEERQARLTDAVNLIYYILELPLTAEVAVVELPRMVAGRCCDGGKLIEFAPACVKDNPEYISQVICHECHHALQHEATRGVWKEWYWRELGITKGRLNTWKDNQQHYIEVDKEKKQFYHYYVQAVECEARAFEQECMAATQKIWSELRYKD